MSRVARAPGRLARRGRSPALVAVLLLLALLRLLDVPGVLPGPARLARAACSCSRCACSSAALAVSYDLLFGCTGLLSFGHALYFAPAPTPPTSP